MDVIIPKLSLSSRLRLKGSIAVTDQNTLLFSTAEIGKRKNADEETASTATSANQMHMHMGEAWGSATDLGASFTPDTPKSFVFTSSFRMSGDTNVGKESLMWLLLRDNEGALVSEGLNSINKGTDSREISLSDVLKVYTGIAVVVKQAENGANKTLQEVALWVSDGTTPPQEVGTCAAKFTQTDDPYINTSTIHNNNANLGSIRILRNEKGIHLHINKALDRWTHCVSVGDESAGFLTTKGTSTLDEWIHSSAIGIVGYTGAYSQSNDYIDIHEIRRNSGLVYEVIDVSFYGSGQEGLHAIEKKQKDAEMRSMKISSDLDKQLLQVTNDISGVVSRLQYKMSSEWTSIDKLEETLQVKFNRQLQDRIDQIEKSLLHYIDPLLTETEYRMHTNIIAMDDIEDSDVFTTWVKPFAAVLVLIVLFMQYIHTKYRAMKKWNRNY